MKKKTKFESVCIISQLILVMCVLILLLMSIFIKGLDDVVTYSLILLMLLMGFNDLKIYKKKKMAIVCFVVSILLIISCIFNI